MYDALVPVDEPIRSAFEQLSIQMPSLGAGYNYHATEPFVALWRQFTASLGTLARAAIRKVNRSRAERSMPATARSVLTAHTAPHRDNPNYDGTTGDCREFLKRFDACRGNPDALFFGHREVRPLVGEMRAELVLSNRVTNADATDHPDSRARNGDPVSVVLSMINNGIAEKEEGEGFADDPICTHESENTVPTPTTSCGGEQVLTPGVTD